MKTNFTIPLKVLSTLFILACSDVAYAQIPNPPIAKQAKPGVTNNIWNINATWSTVTEATGYELDVSLDNFSTFVTGYNSKVKTNTADYISGLVAATTYKFRVRATNGSGASSNSNVIEVTTGASGSLQTVVPKAGKNVSSTGFTAEWNTMAGATGYQLDISADNFATFLAGYNSKSIGATSTEIVTGLMATTTYQYRLRTVNGSGISANSSVTNVTTLDTNPNTSQMLDITFDTDGLVTTAINAGQDYINSIAIQSDGKIVAAGAATVGGTKVFALARYNTDGSLDNTFGTGGIVTTAIGSFDAASAVAIQPDGKIVAAGASFGATLDFAVVRYNSNGTLDNTFDTDGIVLAPIGTGNDVAGAIVIQTDGKIVLGGSAIISNVKQFALARFNTNGSLDNTFDTDGVTITAFGTADSEIKSIAIQTDGKIVATGTGSDGFALARYNADGSLDITFDVDGKITSDAGAGKSIVLQTDGKIVTVVDANKVFGLVRYTTNGMLDNTFGTSGKVITQFVGEAVSSSLVLQPDGKIIVAGNSWTPASILDFALARYLTNGNLDTSFGTGGKLYTDMGAGGNVITSVVLQADGKIVVGGSINIGTTSDFALARYIGTGGVDTTPPTVTITSTSTDPTNTSPIAVTITFSETVTGFVIGDIGVTNGTAGTFVAVSGTVYTANITPTAPGIVTVSVAASVATDAATNGNTAAVNLTIVFDNVTPTVTITSTAVDPTNVSPIPVTITFNETVTGFVIGDIVVTNGTAGTFVAVSGTVYTANITPTAPGIVTVSVAASVATDAATNGNTAAVNLTIVFDNVTPTVTITSTAVDPTNVSPIPVTITFNETVTGFVIGDIVVTNGTAGTFVAVSGTVYTANITPVAEGVVSVSIAAAIATDGAGNNNLAAASFNITYSTTVKLDQTITFNVLSAKTLGDAPFTISATATSNLAVTYSPSAKITISGSQVTLVAAGQATIKAQQAGNTTFNAAPVVGQMFCINPAKPTVTMSNDNTEAPLLTSSAASGNQWYKDGTAISGATNATLTVAAAGVYSVESTVEQCKSTRSNDFPMIVTGDISGSLTNTNRLQISPNPSHGWVVIQLPGEGKKDVGIFSVNGLILESKSTEQSQITLDNSAYGNGLYIIRVNTTKGIYYGKFIKD